MAKILHDTFKVNLRICRKAISEAGTWANQTYQTPDWDSDEGKRMIMDTIYHDDVGLRVDENSSYFLSGYQDKSVQHSEYIITELYVRALFYFLVASSRSLNYYPDSMRIPLITYLNSCLNQSIYKFDMKLFSSIDARVAKKISHVRQTMGMRMGGLVINLPSSFALIIEGSRSKDDILEKAIELRHSKDIVKLRNWLSKFTYLAKGLSN